jgi:hypothetical protein
MIANRTKAKNRHRQTGLTEGRMQRLMKTWGVALFVAIARRSAQRLPLFP